MDGIRKENLLGNDKYIVGSTSVDLVLETLGKVYIKIGRQTKVLSDVLSLLDNTTSNDNVIDSIILVKTYKELTSLEYPGDGKLIYEISDNILYIAYNNGYIAIVEGNVTGAYVKKTGDVMSGQLEITTSSAPLIVASSSLVNNLNAQYINSYSSEEIAKKAIDEIISGKWTFNNNLITKGAVRAFGNIVTSANITSPSFLSGFSGYGWRIDSDTNTLTIDNLIVRKTMKVYELVVNKISATNGSIWISNSSKCSEVNIPTILTQSQVDAIGDPSTAFKSLLVGNKYFIVNTSDNIVSYTKSTELSSASELNTTTKTFTCYKYIAYVKDVDALLKCNLFTGLNTLYNNALVNQSTFVNGDYSEDIKALRKCLSIYPIYQTVSNYNEATGARTYSDSFNKFSNFYAIYDKDSFAAEGTGRVAIEPYFKYFASNTNNLYIITTDKDELPLFKAGDLIRCQKYINGQIKYYDGIILNQIGDRQFILQKALSVFDQYTNIIYDDSGSITNTSTSYNNIQYDKSQTVYNVSTGKTNYTGAEYTTGGAEVTSYNRNNASKLAESVDIGDSLVQIGNIEDTSRQNAIYLTSSDEQGPYIDVITGLNRPDYSVMYTLPRYDTISAIYTPSDNVFGSTSLMYEKRNWYHQETIPDIKYIQVNNSGEISNTLSKTFNHYNDYSTDPTIGVNTRNLGDLHLYSFKIGTNEFTHCNNIPISITYTAKEGQSVQYSISTSNTFTDWYDIVDNIRYDLPNTTATITLYVKLRDKVLGDTLKYYVTKVPTSESAVVIENGTYQCDYAKTTKVRIGNLEGIYDPIFSNKQPYGYGLYSQNVFLTGEFYLNNGKTVVDFAQDGIKLFYKNAGLTVGDLLDSYGNPTGGTCINMTADKFFWNITKSDGSVIKKAMSLFLDKDGNIIFDVQGWIQSNGLYIKDHNNEITTQITPEGYFTSKYGTLENITANSFNFESGTIGSGDLSTDVFVLNGNSITNTSASGNTMLLSTGVLRFTGNGTIAMLGQNIIPASGGQRHACPMLIKTSRVAGALDSYSRGYGNIGIDISVTGIAGINDSDPSCRNAALLINQGAIVGLRYAVRRISTSTELSKLDSVIFITNTNTSGDIILSMPNLCEDGQAYFIQAYPGSPAFSLATTKISGAVSQDSIHYNDDWKKDTYATPNLDSTAAYRVIYDIYNSCWNVSKLGII